MEAAWSSLEEYFALNASIERVFRDSRSRFQSGPAHILTAELLIVAGVQLPEIKTKIATAVDIKGSSKEHPDLLNSVAREAAEAWAIVEQANKLCRVQFRAKDAVARMGEAKKKKTARVGCGGQGSSLALAIQSCVAVAGTTRSKVTGWPTARPSERRCPLGDSNRPLLSLVPLGSSPLSNRVLRKERARQPTRVKRGHSRVRVRLCSCAPFSLM